MSGYSFFTPRCALVPEEFYSESASRELLSATVRLSEGDKVAVLPLREFGAFFLYVEDEAASGVRPELYEMLRILPSISGHNRIVASYGAGRIFLAIAAGGRLMLANSWEAVDFTTAEYFIFNALRSLQMNPEVSVIHFRTPLTERQQESLFRYFRSVEMLPQED